MRFLTYIILVILFLYILTIAFIYFNQRNMLYHPAKEKFPLSYYKINNSSEVTLTTSDNILLQAWFRPADRGKEMVIFLHGNSGSLDDRAQHLQILAKMGYGFIIPSWRSFGKSKGNPSLEGLYNDARAAIKYVQDKGYKLSNTIIIGESLGTGIATEMAVEYKFKGLFLITPYTSIADRTNEIYPYLFAHYLTKDNFNVLSKISKIDTPLLIIHGTNDNVVPYQHSEKIFAQANVPKKLIIYPGANHTNYKKEEVFLEMNKYFTSIANEND